LRLVAITAEPPSPELDGFLREQGADLPIYYDPLNEIEGAFHSWRAPWLFVADRWGRIRFEPDDLDDAARQLEVLQMERNMAA
ncbi:MAG: hypothetical protein ACE5JR_11225, partial [Gemmatimonadota bacterium]